VSYRNLLNTKLSTFQTIKFETVKYSLIGPNNWNRLHPLQVNFTENALLNIINSVKDKSRQISMSFDDVKQPTLVKYAHLFQGIFKFHLTGCYSTKNYQFSNSLAFEIFNEIHHLRLKNIFGIPNLSKEFRNVVKLELIDCGFTRIEDLNPLKSLQDFKIIQKGDLTILCALDDIARIEISSNCDVQLTFPKNCLTIELCACRLNLQYNNDCSMNKTLLYEHSLSQWNSAPCQKHKNYF
jgi:hypothetical protein